MNVLISILLSFVLLSCATGPNIVVDNEKILTSEGKLLHQFNRPFKGKAGKKFTFLVIGDSRHGSEIAHRKVIAQMAKHPADLYMHVGDFVNGGANIPEWIEYFEIQKPLLDKMLLIPVIGNHDLSGNGVFRRIFLSHRNIPAGQRYFTVDYGRVFFIVLDSNIDLSKGTAQYDFLIKELEAANKRKVDHIFVGLHHPLWSSSVKHGNDPELIDTLAPVFSKYKVRTVFAGHDHNYERIKPQNGVHYFVTGGGGSPLRPVKRKSFSASAIVTFHFLKVSILGDKVKVDAIDQAGKIIDTVEFN